jgi:tetratricopeptide (TPR) repeat protein
MQEGSSPTISDVAEALLPGGVKGCTPDACKDLGNQMLQAGKVQDAIWLYTLGLDKRAGCHVLHSNRSAAYARLGEWVKALEDADACVLHNAGWARGHARRGAALEGMGRLDDAIAAHETVLTLDAGNAASPQAIEALKEKKRQKQGGEEDVYKTGSKSTNLVASTETGGGGDAGAEQPDPAKEAEERAKAKAEKIQRYKDRGNKAVQAGNFEDAIDNYSTAIELDPSNHVLYSNRAAAYCSVNQFQSALKDAQKCINLAPKFAKGYGRKAAALCGLNRRGEAVQSFHQGLSQCPEDGGLMKGLAELMPPEHKPRAGDEAQQAHKDDEQGGAADAAGTGAGAEEKKEEAAPKKAEVPQLGEEELAVFSQFMSETGHLERSQQVERIIKYRLVSYHGAPRHQP